MKIKAAYAVAALVCAGCAHYTVPSAHLTGAQTSIASARGSGAQEDPQAALHLHMAEEQYSGASGLIRRGSSSDARQADLMLLRSQADAQLAQALSEQAAARRDADRNIERSSPGLMEQSLPQNQ